ncbi:MAG: adenylosuccinate synthase [Bacteroidales bacterium]|nr:adenylosuccinate synthase [Bacteroidales bacterium]MCF8387097.1 adenylosuccinate synthase [Bacteroidales bacterium]MCF8397411.1 adenylosuccinate synthase [Bacteroidales bacterium]
MKLDVLLGLQWGDEGKGKIVDFLTPKYDIVARFQGGPNAGHTIEFDHNKFILHTIPSGIFDPAKENIIGNGVIIDPYIINKEIQTLKEKGIDAGKNLRISKRAHLILPSHRLLDATYENAKGKLKIGSTLKGIGPTYSDKTARDGLRIGDLFAEDFNEKYSKLKDKHLQIVKFYNFDFSGYEIDGLLFEDYERAWMDAIESLKKIKLSDTEYFINEALDEEKPVLAEGAQGTMLDIDFGSYPFVTSSNTITSGVCSGLGVAPKRVGKVIGIFKAYCTRVGSGPFPTELENEDGQQLRDGGKEYGSTTGRPRRCGWLDLPALKYAIMINGVDELIMMKADVLSTFKSLKVATHYLVEGKQTEKVPMYARENCTPVYKSMKGWNSPLDGISDFERLPSALKQYMRFIESEVGVPIKIVSTGPDRTQTIIR